MRSIIAILALGLICGGAGAAVGPVFKGAATIGGSASIWVTSGELYDDRTNLNANINPTFGWFTANGAMIGVTLDYTYYGEGSRKVVGLGPRFGLFGNSRVAPVDGAGGKLYPYLEAFALLEIASQGGYGGSQTGTGAGAQAGVIPMLSNAIGLDISLGWRMDHMSSITANTYRIGVGLRVFLWDDHEKAEKF